MIYFNIYYILEILYKKDSKVYRGELRANRLCYI